MAEKEIKSRIVHKHDTEANWIKATNFIPKQGEIIVYDIDDEHPYERLKIGDGETTVNNLPFYLDSKKSLFYITLSQDESGKYVADKTSKEIIAAYENGDFMYVIAPTNMYNKAYFTLSTMAYTHEESVAPGFVDIFCCQFICNETSSSVHFSYTVTFSGQFADTYDNVNIEYAQSSWSTLTTEQIEEQFAAIEHTHTKSQITDFPTSMKNPYALTINGASYTGSAPVSVNTPKAFYITVTGDGSGNYSSNKTLKEIVTAYRNGNALFVIYDGKVLHPYGINITDVTGVSGAVAATLTFANDEHVNQGNIICRTYVVDFSGDYYMDNENLQVSVATHTYEMQTEESVETIVGGKFDNMYGYISTQDSTTLNEAKAYTDDIVAGKADKNQCVFYIVGGGTTDTTNKVATWTGSHSDITSYYDGLMIAYKVSTAGSTTTTLNINNLGAVTVVKNASTGISSSYPVNSVVILVYSTDGSTAYWKTQEYDANTRNTVGDYQKNSTKLYFVGTTSSDSATTSSYATSYTNSNIYVTTDNVLYSAQGFQGTLNGNATSATKLGSATVGGATQPIYLNAGTATKITAVGTEYGGTGATTAAGARTNLDVFSKSEVNNAVAQKTQVQFITWEADD